MVSFVCVVVAIVAVADVCVLVSAIGLRLWFGCSCYSRLQAGSLESQRRTPWVPQAEIGIVVLASFEVGVLIEFSRYPL